MTISRMARHEKAAVSAPQTDSTIDAYEQVIQFRRAGKPTRTICCPCCGVDTFIAPATHSVISEPLMALRERMKRAGMPMKWVRYWTTERATVARDGGR